MAETGKALARSRPARYLGFVDHVGGAVVTGWGLNTAEPDKPAKLTLYVDDKKQAMISCSHKRADVKEKVGSDVGGFCFTIDPSYQDGCEHTLRLNFADGTAASFVGADESTVALWRFKLGHKMGEIEGFVDGLGNGGIQGWVVRRDEHGALSGRVDLQVLCDGKPIEVIQAALPRHDVGNAKGCEPNVGFFFSPPAHLKTGREHVFSFVAMPEGTELVHSPFTTSFLGNDALSRVAQLQEQVDLLLRGIWQVRAKLADLQSSSDYDLQGYNDWARSYFPALTRRVAEQSLDRRGFAPLVSVICPVYKPRSADFIAAVQSVSAQTYRNWELIIVDDDPSGSNALRVVMDAMVAADSRIRLIRHATNKGISAATNTALAAARGEYIALFDHDDLLVNVALEASINAFARTGAKVVYSDEDKIDDSGMLSEVHLKPDWNNRLLMGMNYVCHLLVFERSLARKVGKFRSRYDGAQDHDYILRLGEAVGPGDIYHLPEILYHWRKTPSSTASSGGAKTYAINAGVNAVSDHIKRRGLPAEVSAVNGVTMYSVRWGFVEEPKVSVIIPFKNQADVTRRCLQSLLQTTGYSNFEVVLVDNGSTTPEALELLAIASKTPKMRVMVINEEFNYSKLNNVAVLLSPDTEMFVFLNNDVFLDQHDWLRVLVNEAMADSSVGIVGAKLVYPQGTVQHAGVVLGVGGVGDHCFKGDKPDAPGYMGRALVAQEYSAVTAACMLVRSSVFAQVGGFDQKELKVAFNDVDLCLKARALGYKVVWTPSLVAEHHESLSRGDDLSPEKQARFYHENQVMQQRHKAAIANDPFYNRHFSRLNGMFNLLSNEDAGGAQS